MELNITEKKMGPTGTVTIRTYKAGTLKAAEPYVEKVKLYAQLIARETNESVIEFLRDRRDVIAGAMKEVFAAGEIGSPIIQKNIVVFSLNYGYDILVQF